MIRTFLFVGLGEGEVCLQASGVEAQ